MGQTLRCAHEGRQHCLVSVTTRPGTPQPANKHLSKQWHQAITITGFVQMVHQVNTISTAPVTIYQLLFSVIRQGLLSMLQDAATLGVMKFSHCTVVSIRFTVFLYWTMGNLVYQYQHSRKIWCPCLLKVWGSAKQVLYITWCICVLRVPQEVPYSHSYQLLPTGSEVNDR